MPEPDWAELEKALGDRETDEKDPDDLLKAAFLKAVRVFDEDAAVITGYFATVEYVDSKGGYGVYNIFPADRPSWQTHALVIAGGEMWEKFLERTRGFEENVGYTDEDDEGEDE